MTSHFVAIKCYIIDYHLFTGLVRDLTNSYPICIHVQNIPIGMCIIAWVIEYVAKFRKKSNINQLDKTDL